MPTDQTRPVPRLIAPETFVIQSHLDLGPGLGTVPINSMLIRGAQPIVVDTGAAIHRRQFLEDLFGLVEPEDVRWLFLSHHDVDHAGNVDLLLDACANAVVVTTWLGTQHLSAGRIEIPPARSRWLDEGDVFDAGDRALVLIRPPLYDSPATRGLLDMSTEVYWAADCFGSLLPAPVGDAADLEAESWSDGFTRFHQWTCPWFEGVEPGWWQRCIARFEARGVQTIAGAHGPVITAAHVTTAIDMLRDLPALPVVPQPGQEQLDRLLASNPSDVV